MGKANYRAHTKYIRTAIEIPRVDRFRTDHRHLPEPDLAQRVEGAGVVADVEYRSGEGGRLGRRHHVQRLVRQQCDRLGLQRDGHVWSAGTAVAPQQDWRYVLALVYGGLDLSTGVVDCGQPARRNLVANWTTLFQDRCANGAPACADSTHNGALWHAFRLDDGSPEAAVFASLIGLSLAPSAGALNGFGVSPYCNALNWDQSSMNGSTCHLGKDKQFVGTGGVFDAVANDGVHRRPPPGTWGDNPDPSSANVLSADVLPTGPVMRFPSRTAKPRQRPAWT